MSGRQQASVKPQDQRMITEANTGGCNEGALLPDVQRLRDLVKFYRDVNQLESAGFWADKVVSLTSGEAGDVYTYANVLYQSGQYQRAVSVIKSYSLDKRYLMFRLLYAQCLYASKEYQEALSILDQSELKLEVSPPNSASPNISLAQVEGSVSLLRAQIHETLDNRLTASQCYRDSLTSDLYSYQSFSSLIHHHMLNTAEEKELLDSLPWSKHQPQDVEMVRGIYENLLKKYDKPGPAALVPLAGSLGCNFDMLVCLAERHFYNSQFHAAYKITTYVLKRDEYNKLCVPLHISVLVELNKTNELFYFAHKLVDIYPTDAVSWLAVGCYYYSTSKQDQARRFLCKATTLSRQFGVAWLTYGHSFAAENEHDQAMAAYFTAAQIMRGCHLPKLYIGLEYGLTNNSKLAERFFTQAHQMSPDDPYVLHEMGVIAFHSKEYELAEGHFLSALERLHTAGDGVRHQSLAVRWEPLLNNLGHVSRKLKKYVECIKYHRQALVLVPHNASSLSSLAYVYSLQGDYLQAISYFHKALAVKKEDTFSTTMLASCLEQIVTDYPPIEGIPEVLPKYTYDKKPVLNVDVTDSSNASNVQPELPELSVDYSHEFSLNSAASSTTTPNYNPSDDDMSIEDTEMEDA